MIFLDKSGKRWRHIKRGTGLLSSTVLVPLGVLVVASLLYLPSWGSFTLPSPLRTGATSSTHTANVLSAHNTQQNKNAESSSSPSRALSSSVSTVGATSPAAISADSPTTTTTSTGTAPPPNSGTTQTTSGLGNQTIQPGNKIYGQSHQPIRS